MFFPESSFWSRDVIKENTVQEKPPTGTEWMVSKTKSTKEKTSFMKVSAELSLDYMSEFPNIYKEEREKFTFVRRDVQRVRGGYIPLRGRQKLIRGQR